MRVLNRSETLRHDQPLMVSLLFALTALVLTLQNPDALDAPVQLVSDLNFPTPAHAMEMRPQGPPPWMDGDQMLSEEAEELPVLGIHGRETPAPAEIRQRPER